MDFKFKIDSEEMRTACEKLRFGGGEAVSFKFGTDQDKKPAVSMVTSDGISQAQTNPVRIICKERPSDFKTNILMLDVVKSVAHFDGKITMHVTDASCRVTCGAADLTVDMVENAAGIELLKEEEEGLLPFGVMTDAFGHALNVAGMFGGSADDVLVETAHNGTYHISFEKQDEKLMMCLCSTYAAAFVGFSKCEVHALEQFEEALMDTKCILRIQNLKALRECVSDDNFGIYLTKIHLLAKDSTASYITTLVHGNYPEIITGFGKATGYDHRYELGRKELITSLDCIRVGMDGMQEKDIASIDVSGSNIAVKSFDGRQEVKLKDTGEMEGDVFQTDLSAVYFRKALAAFSSDRIIFRTDSNRNKVITLCDNPNDWAVLVPLKREAVEEKIKALNETKEKKKNGGKKTAKAVDIEE